MKKLRIIIVCLASLGIACEKEPPQATQSEPQLRRKLPVPHGEAHAKIDEAGRARPGRLGLSLETSLQIEGVRGEHSRGTRTLLVDTISGKTLEKPVGIWIQNVWRPGLPSGVRCVFKGYETGRVIGCSPDGPAEHQFSTSFVVTEVVQPPSVRIGKEAPNQRVQRTAKGRGR